MPGRIHRTREKIGIGKQRYRKERDRGNVKNREEGEWRNERKGWGGRLRLGMSCETSRGRNRKGWRRGLDRSFNWKKERNRAQA